MTNASLLEKTHAGVTDPEGLVIKCHHDICMVLEGLMQHGQQDRYPSILLVLPASAIGSL
jgi:hypothetical protein